MYEQYKPGASKASFDELQQINPDVFAWLTIYGTMIDYPLTQCDNNWKYISTDATGKYSLTGSLFLDYENKNDFSDFNSIIYGHNMVPNSMFGDIKEFKKEYYFGTHKYGNLFYNGKNYGLEIFAMAEFDAYDNLIYKIGVEDKDTQQQYIDYIFQNAICTRDIGVTTDDNIVLLSTCAPNVTNGRDVLFARITDKTFENEFATEDEKANDYKLDNSQYATKFLVFIQENLWLPLFIILLLFAVGYICKHKKNGQDNREK
jgi:sortase B